MTVSKNNCIAGLLEKFPDFTNHWENYKEWWGDQESGFYNDMSEFSHYVMDLMIEKRNANIEEVFVYMEYLLTEGDEDVKNAVTTCFLENILNQTPERINPCQFVPYLGEKSKEYCKEWDRFTGHTTEGLW